MKIAAVICEFNPFHNGHKYLLETIKNNHADAIVAIMSGSFMQRGDIAITNKYKRAECALKNGCDLVVELPTVFAVSSAENFAKGGVDIAKALGVDMLCFGAEDDNTENLQIIADIFSNGDFCIKLKSYIANGEYYPKAVSMAINEILGQEYADILNKPNNTLAVEYIKALKGSKISPVSIKRSGADHDSDITSSDIASATHIRNLILNNGSYLKYTDMIIDNPASISRLETAILYRLKTMSKDELSTIADVSEGLHNRISECAKRSSSLEELYDNLKTKRYTLARIRRIVMCALLNITKEDANDHAQYVRVLGMNSVGAQILKNSNLPVLAKIKQDFEKLDIKAKKQFDIDARASEIHALALKEKRQYKNDFTAGIIKL